MCEDISRYRTLRVLLTLSVFEAKKLNPRTAGSSEASPMLRLLNYHISWSMIVNFVGLRSCY